MVMNDFKLYILRMDDVLFVCVSIYSLYYLQHIRHAIQPNVIFHR